MSDELTSEQKAFLDKMVEENGVEYVEEWLRRMVLYLGTDEERASLRNLPSIAKKSL